MTATTASTRARDDGSAGSSGTVVLEYTLTALSRVSAARSGEVGNSRRIHEVLPGSVVRGALGSAWWAGDAPAGADAARFRALFEFGMIVRQVVPDGMTLEAISARRCKYPTEGCPSSWHDLARGGAPVTVCPTCGGALDQGRGWAWTTTPNTVAVTRTALAENETASDDQLFTRRALRSQTVLRGSITVLEPDAHAAEIEWLVRPRELRVGGQRSHMGRVAWECTRTAALPDGTPAAALPVAGGSQPAPGGAGRVAIRARSPLIMVDDYGAPTTDIAPTLRLRWPDATVVDTWTRPVRVSGWHVASGLPKPEDLACEAGSTFVIEGLPADAAGALALGLGLRRLEGFGDIELLRPEDLPAFGTPVAEPRTVVGTVSMPQRQPRPGSTPQPQPGSVPRTPEPTPPEQPTQPAPPEPEPHPPAPPPAASTDPVDRLLAVLPASEIPGLLTQISAGVGLIRLRKSAGFSGSMLDPHRQSILMRPWALDLGAEARDRLLALLETEDLDAVKFRLDALKEKHR